MSLRPAMASAKEYWPLLGEVWSDTENFWQERSLWRVMLTSPKDWLLERCMMMSKRERITYAKLPGKVTVYRGGHAAHERAAQTGYSWTTDINVFSTRYLRDGQTGMVFEREVFKRDVIATLDERGEHEVVLSPEILVPGRNACRLVERTGRFRACHHVKGKPHVAQRRVPRRPACSAPERGGLRGRGRPRRPAQEGLTHGIPSGMLHSHTGAP